MSKHRGTDPGAGESTPSSNGGSSASGVPVQVTNVVQIITEHVPAEYAAVLTYIGRLKEQTEAAEKYRAQLERIAGDAGVTLSPQV